MNIGDSILCPVFSLTHKIDVIVPDRNNVFEIVKIDGKNFLKTTITEEDIGRPYGEILLKFKICCSGLSIATLGHFWVQDILMTEDLTTIWKGSRAIHLVKDREIDKKGPGKLEVRDFNTGEQLMGWVSLNYPRVFLYHSMGMFLLRVTAMEDVYPEALLNFLRL